MADAFNGSSRPFKTTILPHRGLVKDFLLHTDTSAHGAMFGQHFACVALPVKPLGQILELFIL